MRYREVAAADMHVANDHDLIIGWPIADLDVAPNPMAEPEHEAAGGGEETGEDHGLDHDLPPNSQSTPAA